jgi:hypothetical protein
MARAPDEAVEARAVVALGALLELGINVERHLRVGVADLAHHPLDVEVVREQCDLDVRAPKAVRRNAAGAAEGRVRAALRLPPRRLRWYARVPSLSRADVDVASPNIGRSRGWQAPPVMEA